MTKPLIEEIELSGTVIAQLDGSYTVTSVSGLTQSANAISNCPNDQSDGRPGWPNAADPVTRRIP
jgi:hypothetical protein